MEEVEGVCVWVEGETEPEAEQNPDTLTPAEVVSMERVRLSREGKER